MKNCRGFLTPRQSWFLFDGDDHCLRVRQRISAARAESDRSNHVEHRLGRACCRCTFWVMIMVCGGLAPPLVDPPSAAFGLAASRQDGANELSPTDGIHGCRRTSSTNSSASVVHRYTRRIWSIDGQSVWSEDRENNIWSGREGCIGDGPDDVTCLTDVGIWSLSIAGYREAVEILETTGNGTVVCWLAFAFANSVPAASVPLATTVLRIA